MNLTEETTALLERWPLAKEFGALPDKAMIMVVGAYKGVTMELLAEMYPTADVLGFEPQQWAVEYARDRLERFGKRCYVYVLGLGTEQKEGFVTLPMGEFGTDACSFVNVGPGSREQGKGMIVDFDWYMRYVTHIEHIDLMIMNIEGYEFDLLPYMINKGWLPNIDKLAVQFHVDFDRHDNYSKILNALNESYFLVVDNLPTWGYWSHADKHS